MLSAT